MLEGDKKVERVKHIEWNHRRQSPDFCIGKNICRHKDEPSR